MLTFIYVKNIFLGQILAKLEHLKVLKEIRENCLQIKKVMFVQQYHLSKCVKVIVLTYLIFFLDYFITVLCSLT